MRIRRISGLGLGALVGTLALLGPAAEGVHAQEPRALSESDLSWSIAPLHPSGLGVPVALDRYRGRVLVLHAWASWCAPCVRELPALEAIRMRLADTDIEFAVVAMEAERPARQFIRRIGLDLPYFLERRRIPSAFRLRGLPSTWILDRQGRIVIQRYGAVDWDTDEAEALLREIAAG